MKIFLNHQWQLNKQHIVGKLSNEQEICLLLVNVETSFFDSISESLFQCCLYILVLVLAISYLPVVNHWCHNFIGATAV